MSEYIVSIPQGNEKITTTVRRNHRLGTLGMTPDGQMYRWAFSGGAIGAGQLVAEAAPVALHDMDLAIQAASAVLDNTIAVTLGSTLATANQYEDGTIHINDGSGEGHIYRIKSNPAAASGATLILTTYDGDPVREALTTADSLAGLHPNAYRDCVVYPTTAAGPALGFATAEVADNTYFWMQVSGYAAVLVDGTLVVYQMCKPSTNTAGAVMAVSFADDLETQPVFIVGNPLAVTTQYQYGRIIVGQ